MQVIVYSKPACQFCDKAKALLTQTISFTSEGKKYKVEFIK